MWLGLECCSHFLRRRIDHRPAPSEVARIAFLVACTSGTVAVQFPPSVVVGGDDCSVSAATVWIKYHAGLLIVYINHKPHYLNCLYILGLTIRFAMKNRKSLNKRCAEKIRGSRAGEIVIRSVHCLSREGQAQPTSAPLQLVVAT